MEKNLTDKDIIKAAEYCANHLDCSTDCPLDDPQNLICCTTTFAKILNRLQSVNTEPQKRLGELTAQKKQLVFICSPYRGETPDEVQQNTRNTEWYCRLAYTLGYIPFAPHLYFTRFLADNCETERKDGMAMGKVIMLQCAELWVFGDKISDGMRSEIAYAEAHSIPVKYLTNGGQTK